MSSFKEVYSKLNKAQKKAVDTIEGPVMVIAGPGTGKTHVLAARIANILEKTDTPPYSILALTFTESAAVNMRERIVSMIGKSGYYVNITTFHSFCADVIKSQPEYFPIDRQSEPLSDLERYELFEEIIEDLQLEILKPINMTLFYISDVIQSISNLKREGIMPEDFSGIVKDEYDEIPEKETKAQKMRREKNKKKNEELLLIYTEYQKRLRSRLRYDFDDMIALVVEAFQKNEMLLREYQEKLHYFLVDEYQDTNSAQNKVVNLLASYWGENANLFVVGDPHQSIFRFQGASIENTLSFAKAYTNASVITLEQAYRSPQLIYDAAHEIILNNSLTEDIDDIAVNTQLQSAKKGKGDPIKIADLPSQTLENVYVIEKVKQLIASGTKPEEIAILYRNNADVEEFQEIFDSHNVLYEIDGGANILQNEYIRQLLVYFQVIHDIKTSQESENLFEIMSYDWTHVSPMLGMKIGRAAGKAKMSIYDLITKGHATFEKHHGSGDVSPIEFHEAEAFIEELNSFVKLDAQSIFTHWFETAIQKSGYLDWLLKHEQKIELLTNINSMYREVKALVRTDHTIKLDGFLQAIHTMKDHHISLYAEDLNVEKGAVHMSTVHRAKGREWEHVFLVRCIDGKWGNTRKRELIPLPSGLLTNTDISKKERNEDDRRLFYVALTRTKKNSYVSYPETIISANQSRDVIPSMFIEEINKKYRKHEDIRHISQNAADHLEAMLTQDEGPSIKITDKEYFARLVKDFKLSVTALNTYLRDVDDFIQNVLLRIPRAKPAPMAFGTAVHYALEQMYKRRMEQKDISEKELLQAFESSLEKELIDEKEFTRRKKYGREILQKYFEEYKNDGAEPVYIERFFGFGFSKTVLGDIPLVGRIDRVDWADKENDLVRVIDYKTGRARSANDIEGKTKSLQLSERELALPESIRGPYKRQLLFYKLLCELDQTFKPTVSEGVFDFVEPNKQTGKLVQRLFILEQDDVNDLKKLIREVMTEIRNLKFLD